MSDSTRALGIGYLSFGKRKKRINPSPKQGENMSQEMSIMVDSRSDIKRLNDLQKKGWRVEKISANHVAGNSYATGSWLVVLRKD